jgi:hypothetical protein
MIVETQSEQSGRYVPKTPDRLRRVRVRKVLESALTPTWEKEQIRVTAIFYDLLKNKEYAEVSWLASNETTRHPIDWLKNEKKIGDAVQKFKDRANLVEKSSKPIHRYNLRKPKRG